MTIGHVRIFKGLKPINPFDTMPMKTMKGRGGSPKQKAPKKMKPMKPEAEQAPIETPPPEAQSAAPAPAAA